MHVWVGVLSALYLIVVSVTGVALMFRIYLQRAVHPDLFVANAGDLAEPATVLERVRDAYPVGRLSGIDAPTTDRPTYLAYVTTGDQFHTILADRVSGAVLGELPEHSLVRTLQDLHFDLLAGRTGRVVNGVGGFCLFLLCLTGLVIWWPGRSNWRGGFTIDWARPWKRIIWEAHGAVGIWTAGLVAIWAVSGIYFAFPTEFRTVVNWVSPVTTTRTPVSVPTGGPGPTWGTLIDRARVHEPDAFSARVVLPATDEAPFQVQFTDDQPTPPGGVSLRTVYLDQFTGARLAEPPRRGRSVGDAIMAWVAPLHVGNFGGIGVRLVWFVTGLAPVWLGGSGLVLWWTRVVTPWRGRSPRSVSLPSVTRP